MRNHIIYLPVVGLDAGIGFSADDDALMVDVEPKSPTFDEELLFLESFTETEFSISCFGAGDLFGNAGLLSAGPSFLFEDAGTKWLGMPKLVLSVIRP